MVHKKNREKNLVITKQLMKKDSNSQLDGQEILMEFFVTTFQKNLSRLKMGYHFNEKLKEKQSSNSFGVGFTDILMELTIPILNNPKLLEKIDFEYQYHISDIKQGQDSTFFSAIPDIDANIQNYKLNSQFGTVSKFYFYFLEAIKFFYVGIQEHLEFLSRQMQYLKKKFEGIQGFQQQMLKGFLEQMENEFLLIKIFIEDKETIKAFNNWFAFYFQHVLSLTKDAIIPEHYLSVYIKYQTFQSEIHKHYFNILG